MKTCILCGKDYITKKCNECSQTTMTTKEIIKRLTKIISEIEGDTYTADNIHKLINDLKTN